jgi:hypothetical protein
VGIPLEQLEPGTVVKTPEVFKALGWDGPGAIFAGGDKKDLSYCGPFLIVSTKDLQMQRINWPLGALGKPVPIPEEFEPIECKELQTARKQQLLKTWQGMGHNYVSGTDPEFFIVDSKDQVIPASRFLQKKTASRQVYFDGLQAEIAPSAQGCLEQLSNGINALLVNALGNAQRIDPTARITARNAFQFTPLQMEKFTDADLQFRCSSSLNIYDDVAAAPSDPREYLWRFAGGHIHIGTGVRSAPVMKAIVRALDGIVGVAGVSLARNFDNPERRRMYGRAGEFRLPRHGLEYRVLSNFWMCSSLIFHLVFELARYAYRIGESGAFDCLYEGTEEEIRSCINHCDVQLAGKLIERNASLYDHIFRTIWHDGTRAPRKAMETLRNGLEVAVDRPEDVLNNWRISGLYAATWGRTFA